ncbi:MAG TPA: TlyA family RNA methyltransferase [Bryobacteraceae bacterium]|jgi:23S rRNA (cytidine1920-2'-O)/16S rRNA (cytidine1409-2'-O)-methyltransferase|nr:TlyA family RNA methyltransferase [Bryobacteraceae bacterium]
MKDRHRLDLLVVERGLAESREKARALILAGHVLVNGQKADKAGANVDTAANIEVLAQPRYVGRGGLKLEAALDHFGIAVTSKVCLDIGSSTGGFTDCLLQRGAARVYAIDAGTGQLDWKLRNDPRVIVHEQTNARHLSSREVPEPIDLAVCDVSFISITMILPAIASLLAGHAEMVILVKPQFELERHQVGKGGIIRDPALHQQACRRVEQAVQALGFQTQIIPSPVLGAEGNQEFLLHARH